MGVPRLFRLPGYKKFSFFPRYYDAQKEELQDRVRNIKNELEKNDKKTDERAPIIKGQMREYFHRANTAKIKRQSNIRLIVIIAVLFIVLYYLLYF
ncbi:MAG: hypothetical protein HN704_14155 [Bacteroidetes bacterium]|jgi:hypothetical protein|nr:hypothetical protein [Bacteroidota bacterium]MBT6685367.1 hypothetical protein [Bacteroidota bacterium]MBT7145053.1 hypothetical protein [Bacteroidota bacterium]MBT7492738.1 hypothetical protein [Bacteroidota bacterium]